jgi:hypothetical protein
MTQEEDNSAAVSPSAATLTLTGESFASSRGSQVKFRIDEDTMKHVERLAADRGTTVVAIVRWLIDRGLQAEKLRSFNDVVDDLALNWARYGDRFLALSLERDLLQALEDRRFEEARAYAVALRKSQEAAARRRVEKLGS